MIYKVISTKKGFLKQSWCFVSCLDSRAGTWINFPPQLAAPMPLFLLHYTEIGPLNLSSLWIIFLTHWNLKEIQGALVEKRHSLELQEQ